MTDTKPLTQLLLVGVDYSSQSELAVTRAFELARPYESAEVHLVSVARPAGVGVFIDTDEGVVTMSVEDASAKLKQYAEGRVASLEPDQAGGLRRVVTHVAIGSPAEQVAQLASDLEADLVLVGTEGKRGVQRLLLGSVAEGVVRLSPCPVLVIRAKQAQPAGPAIEPPCPRCVAARFASEGAELWCEQHRERHGRRHTYHYVPRNVRASHSNMPLVTPLKGS